MAGMLLQHIQLRQCLAAYWLPCCRLNSVCGFQCSVCALPTPHRHDAADHVSFTQASRLNLQEVGPAPFLLKMFIPASPCSCLYSQENVAAWPASSVLGALQWQTAMPRSTATLGVWPQFNAAIMAGSDTICTFLILSGDSF